MENLEEQIKELQKIIDTYDNIVFSVVPASPLKAAFRTSEAWMVCTISNTTILRRPY